MTTLPEFDPTNIEHLKAIKHLAVHGTWPEDFFPSVPHATKFLAVNEMLSSIAILHINEKLKEAGITVE